MGQAAVLFVSNATCTPSRTKEHKAVHQSHVERVMGRPARVCRMEESGVVLVRAAARKNVTLLDRNRAPRPAPQLHEMVEENSHCPTSKATFTHIPSSQTCLPYDEGITLLVQ